MEERGIALGGFMGTGKTTIGRLLAKRLNLDFIDLDDVLAAHFGPIADQFAKDGEEVFRAREAGLIEALADVERVAVIATGGGAWVDPENREALRQIADLVVLTAPLPVLRDRVGSDPGRPLWDSKVEARWQSRQRAYADADLTIDTSEHTPEQAVEAIIQWRLANEE